MALNESDRHELYQQLERTIGRRSTETIMSLLPPVGWADVATRQDLRVLEARLEAREALYRPQTAPRASVGA